MNKQVKKNRNVITKTAVNVKYQNNCQPPSKTCVITGLESNLINISPSVPKSDGHEPTIAENTANTNFDFIQNKLANTNMMDCSINLSSPGLCSALQIANEIQLASIEIKNSKHYKMPPERDEKLKAKAVQKANIPFSKQIFKNLVGLHINDNDIVSEKKLKTKNASYEKKCDSAFILSNFYEPSFSTQCCAQIQSQKVDVEKVQFYNGVDMYNYTELLNSF